MSASVLMSKVWLALLALGITLPWLVPFTTGPNTGMVQWLSSSFCTIALILAYAGWGGRIEPHRQVKTIAAAWLAAALLSSVIALLQYAGAAGGLAPWVATADVGEAYSNLRQRNQFATLTSIGLIALMFLAPGKRWWWVAVVLLACANAASSSRTGAVQWLVIACAATWWSRNAPGPSAGMAWRALVMYALAVVAVPRLLETVTGLPYTGLLDRLASRPGCESRLTLWANVLELIGQSPWTGWGWGGLKLAHFMHPYTGDRFCALLDNAHNLPLQLAVELGLPLALLLLTGAAWWVWRQRPWAELAPGRQMAWSVLLVIGLHSLLEYPLWYGPFQMAALLALAMLVLLSAVPRIWFAASAALAMVVWLWLAWDYTRITQLYLQPENRIAAWREDTLAKVRTSRFFRDEVLFAEITTTTLTPENAADIHRHGTALLRFSPEPRVVQVVLDSAFLLGLNDAPTRALRARFASVYPVEYAQWRASCTGCAP